MTGVLVSRTPVIPEICFLKQIIRDPGLRGLSMVEKRPLSTFLSHFTLIVGAAIIILPIYIAFVASTHTVGDLLRAPIPFLPGSHLWQNYKTVLVSGVQAAGKVPISLMMWNSLIMALAITVGKIALSIISAYAVVFFNFRFRMLAFWIIFITLMLPVEVRILPSFEVAARLDLLNSYVGLSLPLMASATATFLFRQFFMTLPPELVEAARIDGAGPIRFFIDILLPLSKTNIAALFVIMFIYGWNQYLWPLVITTHSDMNTIVMGIQQLADVADQVPAWNQIMATSLLATFPPIIVVLTMQRWFVKGLVEEEK